MNASARHLFLLFSFLLFSAGMNDALAITPGLRGHAERLFNSLKYSEAAKVYLQLTDVKEPLLADMEQLAECYRKMNKYKDAEIWYARIVKNPESKPENLFLYGEVLKANANYTKAKKSYQSYVTKTKDKKRVAVNMAGCDSARIWISNPTSHIVKNEDMVNTPNSEFGVFPSGKDRVYYVGEPVLTKGKENMYGWTGNGYLRIFSAVRTAENTLFAPEIPVLPFNEAPYHVGPVATDTTGEIFLVTRTYPGKTNNRIIINGNTYSTQNMELFIQGKILGKWKEPEAFAFNNIDQYSVGHPTLSPDEQTLYFVSNMPGGKGGTDIWYTSKRADGTWNEPINAGDKINSVGNELFPFISNDSTLYFSSTGFPGMGGLDIFRSKGSGNQWSTPVNMRYPINSPGDDFSFVMDKDRNGGYFASNRDKGLGGDDIYSFVNPKSPKIRVLLGTVYNKKNGQMLSAANVTLFDRIKNIVAKQDSRSDGGFAFNLSQPVEYSTYGSKAGFYPDTFRIDKKEWETKDTINVKLYLDPLFEKGKTFRLRPIYYNFDKYNIRADASLVLDELLQTLHENPTLMIELASHTDCRGTSKYNDRLSQNRAQAVVDYLVSRGISRDRMVAKGYGESKLINRCADGVDCSEEEHQENRRTEFTVISW
jgi:outer membrane protein OmpA-like peptidoglycan-associated protein/tetratricopeptide (TPR) repeat protein